MIDKEERRGFLRWLNTASDRELTEKTDELAKLIGLYPLSSEGKRDAKFLLRLTREEVEARECVHRLHNRKISALGR